VIAVVAQLPAAGSINAENRRRSFNGGRSRSRFLRTKPGGSLGTHRPSVLEGACPRFGEAAPTVTRVGFFAHPPALRHQASTGALVGTVLGGFRHGHRAAAGGADGDSSRTHVNSRDVPQWANEPRQRRATFPSPQPNLNDFALNETHAIDPSASGDCEERRACSRDFALSREHY